MAIPKHAQAIGAFEKHLKPDPDPRSEIRRDLSPLLVHTVILPTPERPATVVYVMIPDDERAKSVYLRTVLAGWYPDERLTLEARMAQYIKEQKPGARVDANPVRWAGWNMVIAEWTS